MRRMHALQKGENSLLRKQTIRIGPSSIPGAGSGVFATKNIKAGTIIGFYPVHGIGLERFDMNAFATASKEDQEYFDGQNLDHDDGAGDFENDDKTKNDGENVANHNYLQYLVGSRPLCGYQTLEDGGTLFIDVNPKQVVQETWIGHFINDGAIVESNTEDGLLDYYRNSAQRKNCVPVPFGPSPILAAVTTSKINKGDELFTTYGGAYWLDTLLQLTLEEEEPVDISDKVQMQAKETAKDLFGAMQKAQVTHASLQAEMEQLFSSTT